MFVFLMKAEKYRAKRYPAALDEYRVPHKSVFIVCNLGISSWVVRQKQSHMLLEMGAGKET